MMKVIGIEKFALQSNHYSLIILLFFFQLYDFMRTNQHGRKNSSVERLKVILLTNNKSINQTLKVEKQINISHTVQFCLFFWQRCQYSAVFISRNRILRSTCIGRA